MGFRDLKAFNLALLAKQGWRILQQPNSLVHRVYKAKYFPKKTFLDAQVGRRPSFVWRSILAARDIIKKGSQWCIGNGQRIHIWNESWIPSQSSSKALNPWKPQYKEVMVANLINTDRRSWDAAKVRSILIPHEAETVLGIPISYRLPENSVIWAGTSNGCFTVKSAYGVAQNCLKEVSSRPDMGSSSDNSKMKAIWKMVWQMECPNKIKYFMWRACRNILPTRNRLKVKGVDCEDCCALCGDCETLGHILWDCIFAKEVWSETKIKLPALLEPVNVFLNLVWEIVDSCPNVNWVLFAVTSWSLWNNRNTIIHGGNSKGKEGLIKSVAGYVEEIKKEKTTQRRVFLGAAQKWNPPKQG